MSEKNIGFIGLGQMGGAMARNILAKHGQLLINDSNPEAVGQLVAEGAEACPTPADMAGKCDTVVLCLPFSPQVREVLFGSNGLLSGEQRPKTILDATTLDRMDALEIGGEVVAARATYWDCPVSGLPKRAVDGTLTIMFGGTAEAFNEAKPVLQHMGESIIHCGELGCGQAMKAVNNVIYNINIAALCEVLPLAQAAGLDPEELARLVTNGSSRSFAAEHFIPKILAGRFADDFAMQDAHKDIVNLQRMATEQGALTPVMDAMTDTYQKTMANGFGREPKHAMIKLYEKALGVEFRSKQ